MAVDSNGMQGFKPPGSFVSWNAIEHGTLRRPLLPEAELPNYVYYDAVRIIKNSIGRNWMDVINDKMIDPSSTILNLFDKSPLSVYKTIEMAAFLQYAECVSNSRVLIKDMVSHIHWNYWRSNIATLDIILKALFNGYEVGTEELHMNTTYKSDVRINFNSGDTLIEVKSIGPSMGNNENRDMMLKVMEHFKLLREKYSIEVSGSIASDCASRVAENLIQTVNSVASVLLKSQKNKHQVIKKNGAYDLVIYKTNRLSRKRHISWYNRKPFGELDRVRNAINKKLIQTRNTNGPVIIFVDIQSDLPNNNEWRNLSITDRLDLIEDMLQTGMRGRNEVSVVLSIEHGMPNRTGKRVNIGNKWYITVKRQFGTQELYCVSNGLGRSNLDFRDMYHIGNSEFNGWMARIVHSH